MWLGELTVLNHLDMTIAVDWDVKHQTKQKNCSTGILDRQLLGTVSNVRTSTV